MKIFFLLFLCGVVHGESIAARLETLLNTPFFGFPKYVEANPPTQASASLGRLLFYDKRLSKDGTISCASCHEVGSAFSNTVALSKGVGGALGNRKANSIVNKAFQNPQFWDGRALTLEEQVLGPLFNPVEMANSEAVVLATLKSIQGYGPLFREVFGSDEITLSRLAKAIADFERTLLSGNSRYDQFQANSGFSYTEKERRGLEIFNDRECHVCHVPPFFSDNLFHNTGVAFKNGHFVDEGRIAFTKTIGAAKPEETGAFKTPTLRDLKNHAPYMHDGSIATLEEVIDFYNRGGNRNPFLSEEITTLGLSVEDKEALIAFLLSLDGQGFRDTPPKVEELPL